MKRGMTRASLDRRGLRKDQAAPAPPAEEASKEGTAVLRLAKVSKLSMRGQEGQIPEQAALSMDSARLSATKHE